MDIQLGTLLGGADSGALGRLANAPMPFATAARFKDVIADIQKALTQHDANKAALFQKYATKNEDGSLLMDANGSVTILPEHFEEFGPAINDLLSAPVRVRHVPFKKSQLLSSMSIAPNDLIVLDWMISTETPGEDWPQEIAKVEEEDVALEV